MSFTHELRIQYEFIQCATPIYMKFSCIFTMYVRMSKSKFCTRAATFVLEYQIIWHYERQKMAQMQGSDGLMRKRKIAILNICSILNIFFLPSDVPKCLLQQVQNAFIC
jgi:hypothetical protein